ncbi:MAG: sodium:solute symporter [Cytophagales bacterium]|nr:MAG: sodium:solute symporter [Cytophagales bacterium]
MSTLDWLVIAFTTIGIVGYGLWRGRNNKDIEGYIKADNSLPWYTITLAVISTQASAVTFLSAPGQAYTDGMRFVLFYLGLPLAMIFVSAVLIPIYYRLNVYTAYQFLETRFDAKVRVLIALFFLAQRSLAAAISIAAPAIVLTIVLGWNIFLTNLLLGGIVIIYTVSGGAKAVSQTQKLQMIIILAGMFVAGVYLFWLLPYQMTFHEMMQVAGKAGKINTMDFNFDLNNRYNFWSGLLGGFFLQLAYFGTDQSQVGRYLGGKNMTQSRLGLLFNGIFKIPMQFSILLIGVILFVFYQFEQHPVFFNPVELKKIQNSTYAKEFQTIEKEYEQQLNNRGEKAKILLESIRQDNAVEQATQAFIKEDQQLQSIKKKAVALMKKNDPDSNTNDTNYIFLTFVVRYLPQGLIGLLIVVILFASMSTTASELSALGSTTLLDIYRKAVPENEQNKRRNVFLSKAFVVFWGIITLIFANLATQLGTLIEAVNILGSLFYGTILGVFLLALFAYKIVSAKAVFIAALIAEVSVVFLFWQNDIAYLWLNMIGCILVVVYAFLLAPFFTKSKTTES